jgi:hypothetical protein
VFEACDTVPGSCTDCNRQTLGYALAAGGVQGSLFAFVFSSEQVFTEIYGLGRYFPLAFAAIAIGVAVAGFLNARFVGRHAGDFAWRTGRLRGGGRDHAAGGASRVGVPEFALGIRFNYRAAVSCLRLPANDEGRS